MIRNNKALKGMFTKRIIILFIFVFSVFVLVGCNSKELPSINNNNQNGLKQNNELKTTSRINSIDVLGLASYKSFETETNKKLSMQVIRKNTSTINISDNNEEIKQYLSISYPYDYIKIDTAQKYHITIDEVETNVALEPIIANCGLGELDVVIATFTTYVLDGDNKLPSVGDTLISIRGVKGFFTILVNSGHSSNGESQEIFSSHKKLTSLDVNKDFEPPIYSIMLSKKQNGEFALSFLKSDCLATFSDFDNSVKYYFNGNEVETITREMMYDVLSLVKLPEVTKGVIVKEINLDNKIITVESQDSLRWLIIDEYTEINDGLLLTLIIGDYIEIAYDDLFKDYKPECVYANSIKVIIEQKTE